MRVLAGLMEVNGYILKQGKEFHALYSPTNTPSLTLTAVDSNGNGEGLVDLILSQRGLRFCSDFPLPAPPSAALSNGISVDLDPVDVERLNAMVASSGWSDVGLVVLLRSIDSELTRCLEAQDGVLPPLVSHTSQFFF